MNNSRFSQTDSLNLLAEMVRVAELVNKIIDDFYKNFKVTRTQFRTLYLLYLLDEDGITLSALSEKLGITRPSVTSLIDRMVSSGLVERFSNEGDRRSIRVLITDKGKEIIKPVIPNDEAFKVSILDFLTEEEKENMYKVTIRLREELTKKVLKG